MQLEERFAYEGFRPGQRELAQRVYEAGVGGEVLLAEAMSGFGKTAAVLTGAVSAAEATGCGVVYACRTKRQIQRVVEEVARMQKRNHFAAASLLSKYDYCLLRRQRPVPQESFGWYCTFNVSNNLCSYFLNVTLSSKDFDTAVASALSSAPAHVELVRQAEAFHLCPYEVAKLALVRAKVAVVPYHYVFDPRASATLFDRGDLDRSKTILVVDEAHNLRDFFRGLGSATLTLEQVAGAVREAEALMMADAAGSLKSLGAIFESAISDHGGWLLDRWDLLKTIREEKGTAWLQNLAFELGASSGAAWGSVMYDRRLPSLILRVGEFLTRLSSAGSALLVKWGGTLGLLDPQPVEGLEEQLSEFRSSVLVSATISPSDVFKRSLGLSAEKTSSYEVPEEPMVTVRVLVDTGTSTRYKLRTPDMFSKIADKVAAVVESTYEGVGVFAPSYSVLASLRTYVTKRVPQRQIISESPGMSTEDAADLFASFKSGDGAVLFAVQGGRFSEGEDFTGDTMGSVVVVGMSLPPPTPMMYAEYACLKKGGEPDSYLMLSKLPALRKAFQAAGRHVRTPGKRGLVFFLDDRFSSKGVRELMPSWLKKDILIGDFSPSSLKRISAEFWGNRG